MRLTIAVLAVLALAAPVVAQQAQPKSSVTSAFSGFSVRSEEPTNIEADNLEVRDQQQSAIFTGNVLMKQGISTLKSRKLTIYYYDKSDKPDADSSKPKQGETKAADGAAKPESGREIKRMEAEGDVVVTQNDQVATGQRGVFDTQKNTAELFGGVVVTQNDNVLRGDRLHVDLTTQTSRIESGAAGRVQGVFKPKQQSSAR